MSKTILAAIKTWWKPAAVLLLVACAFIAGNVWSDRSWQSKWAERDSAEASQFANAQNVNAANQYARDIVGGKILADQ